MTIPTMSTEPVQFFLSGRGPNPPMLYRRTNGTTDEVFRGAGKWESTKAIIDLMFGHNDDLEEATEAQARAAVPAAF